MRATCGPFFSVEHLDGHSVPTPPKVAETSAYVRHADPATTVPDDWFKHVHFAVRMSHGYKNRIQVPEGMASVSVPENEIADWRALISNDRFRTKYTKRYIFAVLDNLVY